MGRSPRPRPSRPATTAAPRRPRHRCRVANDVGAQIERRAAGEEHPPDDRLKPRSPRPTPGDDHVKTVHGGPGHTPSMTARTTMSIAPVRAPASPWGRPRARKAWGANSTITSASIAPAANANENASRPFICSTRSRRRAPRQAAGTRGHRGPELLPAAEAGCLHRDRNARALRDVLQCDCEDHVEPEAFGLGERTHADGKALRQAVHEETAKTSASGGFRPLSSRRAARAGEAAAASRPGSATGRSAESRR